MVIKRILVFYKKSTLDISKDLLKNVKNKQRVMKAINQAHDDHYTSLKLLETQLKDIDLPIIMYQRSHGKMPSIKKTDLILSLGGDGTFIFTSHFVKDAPILGINSAPNSSVGFYCPVNVYNKNFNLAKLVNKIKNDKAKIVPHHRLDIKINNKSAGVPVLNDILFTETNPASTSRYQIEYGKKRENHKSSGLWISTASGSTAAYSSAGGKPFKPYNSKKERQWGFRVRELYLEKGVGLQHGLVSESQNFSLLSTMADGKIFFDGGYTSRDINLGDKINIGFFKHPLKVIMG